MGPRSVARRGGAGRRDLVLPFFEWGPTGLSAGRIFKQTRYSPAQERGHAGATPLTLPSLASLKSTTIALRSYEGLLSLNKQQASVY
jgi:hypothetical protein